MRHSYNKLHVTVLGIQFILAGLNANATVPFAPKTFPANTYKCYSDSRTSFSLSLKTEDSMDSTSNKLLVELERKFHSETSLNFGVALPGSPEGFPTRVHYVAGPFVSKTSGDLGEHTLKFIAQSPLDLRGVISGSILSGGFHCQSRGEFSLIGQAKGTYSPGAMPDVDTAKLEADQSAALACGGLHTERMSDYEVGPSLLGEDGFLHFSVHAYYTCEDLPV